jgi:carboxyl-terminal processing protease
MNSRKLWLGALVFSGALVAFTLSSPALFARDTASGEASSDRYLQILQYVFGFIQENYVDEVDARTLYEGAMKGMLDSLGDPYTAYIDKESILGLNLKDTTTGAFGGVGLYITKPLVPTQDKPAYVEVTSPIEDTPGWKAGIQPGDLILSIDGVGTADITMEDVLARLRGPVGSPVTVQIKRGKLMEFPVTITRGLIEVPTVKYEMMPGGIGYLRIIEFTPITPGRVQDALDAFEKAGYTGLLIDLRNNPGGLITSVVDVADKFIDEGVIVSTRSRISYENREFKSSKSKTTAPKGLPIVVLINKGSASASEILAGALKDYRLAYLVGETTYGKGSVQQIMDLLNQDAMKITMARYYTPSGANIDKLGIPPDREIAIPELTEDEQKALGELFQTTKIADFIGDRKELSSAEAEAFAKTLQKEYKLELRLLKRLVVQEYYRTHISPTYDLEYDVQLKGAVDILRAGKVRELSAATKTVLELQEAQKAVAAEETARASSSPAESLSSGSASPSPGAKP